MTFFAVSPSKDGAIDAELSFERERERERSVRACVWNEFRDRENSGLGFYDLGVKGDFKGFSVFTFWWKDQITHCFRHIPHPRRHNPIYLFIYYLKKNNNNRKTGIEIMAILLKYIVHL